MFCSLHRRDKGQEGRSSVNSLMGREAISPLGFSDLVCYIIIGRKPQEICQTRYMETQIRKV